MNFKAIPSYFNLSTFNSPLIAFVTIIAYLNMILLQLSSAVAMESRDVKIDTSAPTPRCLLIKNLPEHEVIRLRQALAGHAKPEEVKKEVIPEPQQTPKFSSRMGVTQDWKSAVSSVVSPLRWASPFELQFLSGAAGASISAISCNTDFAEPILMLWGSYMAVKAVRSGFGFARQFANEQYQRWFVQTSTVQEISKLRWSPIQLDPETAKIFLQAGVIAASAASAGGISVTNLNQNLTYAENVPLFLRPNQISTAQALCQGVYTLVDPKSGSLCSLGLSSNLYGVLYLAGNCIGWVEPRTNGTVIFFPAVNYTKIVHIIDTFADGINNVMGDIYIYNNPQPSPSPSVMPPPTCSLTPTTVTPSPTTLMPPPSPSPTLLPSPSPTLLPTPSPTLLPSPSPTLLPPPSPTLLPTPSISIEPTVVPTSSMTPTPFNPTPFDTKPFIITGIILGSLLLICCFSWLVFAWSKDKKNDKKREPREGVQPTEVDPLIQQ